MRLKRWLVVLLVVILALPATGCGSATSNVTGTVTLDGEPLNAGTIIFMPAKGAAVSTEIKAGKYTALKVPDGEVKVMVENNTIKRLVELAKKSGPPIDSSADGKPPRGGGDIPAEAKAALEKQQQEAAEAARRNKELIDNYRPVPEKYNDPNQTDLKFTVGSGSRQYDPKLTSQ